ncbi:MAG: NAD(P)(+) transhydrogenase (Re/Si-specific) subunit beta [Fermentimonas sp.]|jgi:NAD(P) transhydrogenase subunit beta
MSHTFYIIACAILSVTVLIGISFLSKVKTAVAGNLISAVSLFLGVVITLVYNNILSAWSIFPFMLIGILIGGALAARVKMIQMPQLVALLNGLGGFASALVGTLSLLGVGIPETDYPLFVNVTSVLAIVVGLVTLFGSLVAAGKLHRLFPQKPVVWKNHSLILNLCLILLVGITVYAAFVGDNPSMIAVALIGSIVISSFFGVAFAIRVGGADMPITISLLNSLSGVAGAIAGMAVNDLLLVAVGGIVGASGLLLTQVMCRAMNRGLGDILTGKTSVTPSKQKAETSKVVKTKTITEMTPVAEVETTPVIETEPVAEVEKVPLTQVDPVPVIETKPVPETEPVSETKPVSETEPVAEAVQEPKPEEEPAKTTPADILTNAKSVIIVPGYGMALAQAQHLVKQLADKLEENGADVKFAIHPVAGRMPGHMNVLLAEADVPYDKLFEMDAVNDDFASTDAAIVIGANDVINPSARDAADTPIYGMPVLNVDQAKEVIICNYDLNPGYSGVDNPLYKREERVHLLLGDAKDSLESLLKGLA